MKQTIYFLFIIVLISIIGLKTYCQNPIKIMPIGNSITQGYTDGTIPVGQMKGYRYDIKQLLLAAGYTIDFVGSETSGNTYFSDCQHAGIGGSRDQFVARLLTDGYDERWCVQILNPPRPYLDEYDPDIILLHIGTNDVTHEEDCITNQKVSLILDLIDQYEVRANREVIVFLGLIINRKKPWYAGSGAGTTILFNDAIETMALSRIANGDKIVIVDMENNAGFVYDATDMADNLHPNATGYQKMANLWYSSIINNFNTAPVLTAIPDQILDEGGISNSFLLDNYVSDLQDPDQDITWSVTQIGTPALNITIDNNRQVTATPLDEDWNGTQMAVFTATDKGKNCKYIKSANDTVLFTVTPVNDAPIFTSAPTLTVDQDQLYTYAFSATDIEPEDVLVFSILLKPDWLTLYASSKLLAGVPIQSGDLPVTLRVSDGQINVDQSFTIKVIGQTPANEVENNSDVRVYPNPATDHFRLTLPGPSVDIDFKLYDITGKLVLRRLIYKNDEPEIYIGYENLSPGVYFYRILLEKEIYIGKLMISK
jgi:lysophospholipase L1-like esterase